MFQHISASIIRPLPEMKTKHVLLDIYIQYVYNILCTYECNLG